MLLVSDDFEKRFTIIFRVVKEKHQEIALIDAPGMKDGDCTGQMTFQKVCGFVGVKKDGGQSSIVAVRTDKNGVPAIMRSSPSPPNRFRVYRISDPACRKQITHHKLFYERYESWLFICRKRC